MSLYSQLDRLASDLETVKKQLHAVANTNQLQRSSVEAGSLDFNDEDGNLKAIIGLQHDGATTVNVVNGPKPPTPAGITAAVDNGRIILRWDGTFAGDLIAPTDWARTEIYAQEGSFVVPTPANARGSFVSAAGGELTIGVKRGTWTVCVAAWSQAGRQSEMSVPITVEVPGFGDLVQEAIDKAEALIEEARTTLEAGQAELTEKLGDLTTDLTDLGYDIDLVQLAQAQMVGDISDAQAKADSAFQNAATAESNATTAKSVADQAKADAAAAAGVAGGKADVLIQSTAPATAMRKATTLWIDTTSSANTPKRWNGTTWVAVTDKAATDAAAAASAAQAKANDAKTAADAAKTAADAAQTAASNAQATATQALTSANSKNTITRSTSNPPASYTGRVDDLWWKMTTLAASGRVLGQYRWTGTKWLEEQIDSAVLAYVDAAKITTGFLDVATLIKAAAITVDKLLIGDLTNLHTDPAFTVPSAVPSVWTVVDGGIELTATGAQRGGYVTSPLEVPVQPGERFYGEMTRQTVSGTASGEATLYIQQYRTGTNTWSTPVKLVSMTADGKSSGTVTLASDTVRIRWGYFVQSNVPSGARIRLTNPVVRRQINSTLIEPGGIQTPSLAADVLEVKNLKAGKGQLNEAVIAKLFSDVVVARMSQAQEFIGENAILTDSITAPKIVASEELTAKIAEFLHVRAEMVEADAIDGMVITGATIRTAGGLGEWSDAGLRINAPDGTNLVKFPTDGSPLSLTASDTNIDRATIGELDVSNGAVRSGGTMSLAAGVTPPASPPELSSRWALNTTLPRPPEQSMDWVGFAVWNGLYVRGVNVLGVAGDPYDRIELYNTDGTLNRSINIDLNPRAGVTVIGDVAYTLGTVPGDANRQWVHGFNLNTGARVTRWQFTRFDVPGQGKLAIGTDGANIVTAGAHVTVSRRLYVMRYNPSTGAQVGSDIVSDEWVAYTKDVEGVAISGNALWVSHREATRKFTISGTTVTYDPSEAWTFPNKNAGGMTFVDGVPIVADSGAVFTGSSFATSTTLQMCYTWWNGSQETTPSPIAEVALAPRESVTASVAKRAGLQKRLYYRAGTSGSWRQAVLGENVTSFTLTSPTWGLSAAPPASNTFPASAPAVLKSGRGAFQVKGDGSGRWGPLTFNADGTADGLVKAATGTVTIGSTVAANGGKWSTVITFPPGRFTTPPAVSHISENGRLVASIEPGTLTTTSVQINLFNWTTGAGGSGAKVFWTAIEEA